MTAILWIARSPDPILQPLILFGLLAAGLALSLCLFVTLKSEIRKVLHRCQEERKQVQALESALGEARLALATVETDLREVQQQTGMLVAPAPVRSGLNLSKRTQVLRMHRSGQENAEIAAALALPRSEVELLIKVHRIAVEQM